jgi:uncharacterized protein (TIGR02270 family)
MVVPIVIQQHAEELATLWATRNSLRAAAHVGLRALARFDERIAAHQDGCVVAGRDGLSVLTAQLELLSAGRVFGVAVAAFDLTDREALNRCIALAEADQRARCGMTAALGWVSATRLTGTVKNLLAAASPVQRTLGLAACRLHGVHPGAGLPAAMEDQDPNLRAEAVRSAGVLGQCDLLRTLSVASDQDSDTRFWSAWSGVLLGNRGQALRNLTMVAASPEPHRGRAFRLACQAMNIAAAHEVLRALAGDPAQLRWLIEGSGIVGDPAYVPWLIKQMHDPRMARLAGECFALLVGADLSANLMNRSAPEHVESGPNDDPADSNVDTDPDDGLPWPDPQKIEKWWVANSTRFHKGTRYFMGRPVTREHCIDVLKNGYQRQRILAAQYLCLLEPGTPLFNTSAPAWRQQRLLAKM